MSASPEIYLDAGPDFLSEGKSELGSGVSDGRGFDGEMVGTYKIESKVLKGCIEREVPSATAGADAKLFWN